MRVSDGLIVTRHLTDERVPDGSMAPDLIKQVGSINTLTADEASVQFDVYQTVLDRGLTHLNLLIYPRTNNVISVSNQADLKPRDEHVKSIKEDVKFVCRKHQAIYQSAVESMFLKVKTLLGDQLRARRETPRQLGSVLACKC